MCMFSFLVKLCGLLLLVIQAHVSCLIGYITRVITAALLLLWWKKENKDLHGEVIYSIRCSWKGKKSFQAHKPFLRTDNRNKLEACIRLCCAVNEGKYISEI